MKRHNLSTPTLERYFKTPNTSSCSSNANRHHGGTSDSNIAPSASDSPVTDTTPMDFANVGKCSLASTNSSYDSGTSEKFTMTVDVGVLLNKQKIHLTDDKIYQFLTQHYKPGKSDVLHGHAVTKKGKTWNVRFQVSWLENFNWLVYSVIEDGGLCCYCVLFANGPNRGGNFGGGLGILVRKPYQEPYTKALGKDGILVTHANAAYHCKATEYATTFLQTFNKPDARVDTYLSKQMSDVEQKHKHVLRQMVNAIIFIGKQSLAYRGHRDDSITFGCEDSTRAGNFVALLKLMSKNDSILKEHLSTAKLNARYTSKTIQNQIIEVIGEYIKETVTNPLRKNYQVFSIIADEVTDPYENQELLALCLRYVDVATVGKPCIKEFLLDIMKLERATASAITEKILGALTQPCVSLSPAHVRGQAYDGAAAMASNLSGVQAQIKSQSPLALFTHCHSHCLNLAIVESCKVQQIRNVIGVINEAYIFIHYSPKRQRMFELTVKTYLPQSMHHKLPGLCKTRWVERHTCFEIFHELYTVVVTFLGAIVDESNYPLLQCKENWMWDKESKIRAQGLLSSLQNFQTIVAFIVTKNSLAFLKPIASNLQKRDQDVLTAYQNIDNVISSLQIARQNVAEKFTQWYDECVHLAQNAGVNPTIPRVTALQVHRANAQQDDPAAFYRCNLAIPFLDSLLTQLNIRFQPDSRKASAFICLIPAISITLSENDLTDKLQQLSQWKEDLPFPMSLRNEIDCWQHYWKLPTNAANLPENLIHSLAKCNEDAYPNIYKLLLIACTLPITSCEAERTFSLMRRLKNFMRSTMGEERLSALCLLSAHYSLQLDVDEICRRFIAKHPRRIFESSMFD